METTHAPGPGEPPRSGPAAMTAHIPELDSRSAADLTGCLALSLPPLFLTPSHPPLFLTPRL